MKARSKSTTDGESKPPGNRYGERALLPIGFRDQMAPYAEGEAGLITRLMQLVAAYGYDRVAPPLVEFEESLLQGPGSSRSDRTFRLMDPDTQRPMALRADITAQISRLATTRLRQAARPLRLAYAGNVVRTRGSSLRPTRQFVQVGAELIGHAGIEAECEMIEMACAALGAIGITALTVDLTLAPLARLVAETSAANAEQMALVLDALSAKDVGGFHMLDSASRRLCQGLIEAAGPIDRAVTMLEALPIPGPGRTLVAAARALSSRLAELPSGSVITLDPCETAGFEYKTGIGFAIFARTSKADLYAKGELARGGRYLADHPDGSLEPAVGFSVYMDTLSAAAPCPALPEKVFVPASAPGGTAASLRREGLRVIAGLTDEGEPREEAVRLGCSALWTHQGLQQL